MDSEIALGSINGAQLSTIMHPNSGSNIGEGMTVPCDCVGESTTSEGVRASVTGSSVLGSVSAVVATSTRAVDTNRSAGGRGSVGPTAKPMANSTTSVLIPVPTYFTGSARGSMLIWVDIVAGLGLMAAVLAGASLQNTW